MTIMNVLSLFGGLGLFLFGMQLMGEALEKAAGTRPVSYTHLTLPTT